MAKRATSEDAALILKLYDLRREPEMRKARNWCVGDQLYPTTAGPEETTAKALAPSGSIVQN